MVDRRLLDSQHLLMMGSSSIPQWLLTHTLYFCNHVKSVLIFYSEAKLKVSQVLTMTSSLYSVNFSLNFEKGITPVLIANSQCFFKNILEQIHIH